MKFVNIKFLAVAIIAMFASVGAFAQIKKADIQATGLTCSMCSNAIHKQLESMPQVAKITTDLNTNTFTVFLKENVEVRPVELKDAVEKAGFFVGSMNLTMKVDAEQIANSTLITGAGAFVFMDKRPSEQEAQYRVLDKGFVTQKEYRELAKVYASHPTYVAEKGGLYHLIAVKQ